MDKGAPSNCGARPRFRVARFRFSSVGDGRHPPPVAALRTPAVTEAESEADGTPSTFTRPGERGRYTDARVPHEGPTVRGTKRRATFRR